MLEKAAKQSIDQGRIFLLDNKTKQLMSSSTIEALQSYVFLMYLSPFSADEDKDPFDTDFAAGVLPDKGDENRGRPQIDSNSDPSFIQNVHIVSLSFVNLKAIPSTQVTSRRITKRPTKRPSKVLRRKKKRIRLTRGSQIR